MDGVSMKVGDLVKLTNVAGGRLGALRGTVLRIDEDGKFHQIFWTDGDITQEVLKDLEVA